ncbi:MAG: acyl--CoA ligase, partial [Treponema sp.]|nr:acyl--CoA ligase [Treponema sp.]
MSKLKIHDPIKFLDDYREKVFNGEWPTIPEMFDITTERYPDRACFTDFEGPNGAKNTLTYRQAHEKIVQLSKWLAANGVKHGDRVAVTGKNSPEWAVVYLAALYAGAIVCPLDYALKIEEQENLLSVAEPKYLFVDDEKYQRYIEKSASYKVYALSPKYQDKYVYNLSTDEDPEIKRPEE